MGYYSMEDYWEEQNEYYDSLPVHYSVFHKGAYYYGEEGEDQWFENQHENRRDAIDELFGLYGAGFKANELYLRDNYPEGMTEYINENGELEVS